MSQGHHSAYVQRLPPFVLQFTEDEFFQLFFANTMLDAIVNNTNLYAAKVQTEEQTEQLDDINQSATIASFPRVLDLSERVLIYRSVFPSSRLEDIFPMNEQQQHEKMNERPITEFRSTLYYRRSNGSGNTFNTSSITDLNLFATGTEAPRGLMQDAGRTSLEGTESEYEFQFDKCLPDSEETLNKTWTEDQNQFSTPVQLVDAGAFEIQDSKANLTHLKVLNQDITWEYDGIDIVEKFHEFQLRKVLFRTRWNYGFDA
ncbi:hypothetical protein BGZ51_008236 [Haplosporangium sp. Z 767]|nr:hypothetical protein BGZ51_008236 [Haplosporangium sp. Z 767]